MACLANRDKTTRGWIDYVCTIPEPPGIGRRRSCARDALYFYGRTSGRAVAHCSIARAGAPRFNSGSSKANVGVELRARGSKASHSAAGPAQSKATWTDSSPQAKLKRESQHSAHSRTVNSHQSDLAPTIPQRLRTMQITPIFFNAMVFGRGQLGRLEELARFIGSLSAVAHAKRAQ
jgi:hypothetical protein